jgi:hypothetical protein
MIDPHPGGEPSTVRNGASLDPRKGLQQKGPFDAKSAVARPQTVSPRVGKVLAPVVLPRTSEPTTSRAGEMTPAKGASRQRETPRSAGSAFARPAVEQASAPRIHVSIGRVEVRAVYASPPSSVRRPASTPSMSLSDYLKQRDGS